MNPREHATTFVQYQATSAETANPLFTDRTNAEALQYAGLGLVGEAGEVAGAIKKVIRDNNGELDDERAAAIADELGDVLWYVARVADAIGITLATVADLNLQKVQHRASAGTLYGDGDQR